MTRSVLGLSIGLSIGLGSPASKANPGGPAGSTTTTIVLPPDYNRKNRYPVLIALPYTGGTTLKFISAYTGYRTDLRNIKARFAGMLRRYYPRRAVRRKRGFILVLPPGRGSERHHRWKGFNEAVGMFEGHVHRALRRLSRTHRIDRKRVALAGHSLGGDLSWALSLRNPNLLSGAIISGSRCSYRRRAALGLMARRRFRFYMAMGQYERPVRLGGMNRAMRWLSRAGIKHRYVTIPNAGHAMLPRQTFKEALEYVLFR